MKVPTLLLDLAVTTVAVITPMINPAPKAKNHHQIVKQCFFYHQDLLCPVELAMNLQIQVLIHLYPIMLSK